MKKRIGQSSLYDYLTADQVRKRIDECGRLSRELEKVSCSLDAASELLSTPSPGHGGVTKAIEKAMNAAITIKTKFGQPGDSTAYSVEKGARDLIDRVIKGPIDAKTATRLKKSIATLKIKATKLEDSSNWWCRLRHYENVGPPPVAR